MASMLEHFMILIACLSAAALGRCGRIGTGTHMSLSGTERAREIECRAIGAPRKAILRPFFKAGGDCEFESRARYFPAAFGSFLGRIVVDVGPHA